MYKFLFLTLLLLVFCTNAGEKHLFILSGQSNMAGLIPKQSFIPVLEKEFGKKNIIVVKDAKGGEAIRRWYRNWKDASGKSGEQNGDLYDRLISNVKPAIKGQKLASVTFLWMQGERDAREKHGDVYKASLVGLIEQVKTDLNLKEINFVIGRLSDHGVSDKRLPHWNKIREIQVELAEDSKNGAWVDTDDLNDGINRKGKKIKNDIHYSKDGYITFGTRLAEKAIQLIKSN